MSSTEQKVARHINKFILLLLATWLLEEALSAGGLGPAPHLYFWHTFVHDSHMASTMMGVWVFYLASDASRLRKALCTGVGIFFDYFLQAKPGWQDMAVPGLPPMLTGWTGLGLIASLFFVYDAYRYPEMRQRSLLYLKISLLIPLYKILGFWVDLARFSTNMLVYDSYCYALESAWGVPPTLVLYQFLNSSPVLIYFFGTLYIHVALFIAIALVYWLRRGRAIGFDAFLALMLSSLAGPLFYSVLPMVGFQSYLGAKLLLGPIPPPLMHPTVYPADPTFPRNCFPSMHATWIFLASYLLGVGGGWRAWAAGLLSLATVISATLNGHYAVDFFVAVPFFSVCATVCGKFTPRRWALLAFNLLNVGLLAALVRYGWPLAYSAPALAVGLQILITVTAGMAHLAVLRGEAAQDASSLPQ